MKMSRPPYRYCWWCSRQFQGPYYREVSTPTGPVFVHEACVAATIVGGPDRREVKR